MVFKNQKTEKWEVRCYYKDYKGIRKQKTKRGFIRNEHTRQRTADHNGSCFPEASGLCHGIPRVQYGWPKIMQA